MFGAPERQTNAEGSYFYVPLSKPQAMKIRLHVDVSRTCAAEIGAQEAFRTAQRETLVALQKNKQLFKNPPSLESLESITPNWGCIVKNGSFVWNPFMKISTEGLTSEQLPAFVDLALTGISITRSTIFPHFKAIFLESDKPVTNVIDFDWDKKKEEDLEEVSDIGASPEGSFTIRNPAQIKREKGEKKAQIRAAFMEAETLRKKAEEMAEQFYAAYDLSDDESAFSEWVSDTSDSEDEVSV